jgi:hypothetical protein
LAKGFSFRFGTRPFLAGTPMPHTRRYVIEIKDTDCRAADWTDKEKRAAVVSVMRLAEPPDINWFNYEEPTM